MVTEDPERKGVFTRREGEPGIASTQHSEGGVTDIVGALRAASEDPPSVQLDALRTDLARVSGDSILDLTTYQSERARERGEQVNAAELRRRMLEVQLGAVCSVNDAYDKLSRSAGRGGLVQERILSHAASQNANADRLAADGSTHPDRIEGIRKGWRRGIHTIADARTGAECREILKQDHFAGRLLQTVYERGTPVQITRDKGGKQVGERWFIEETDFSDTSDGMVSLFDPKRGKKMTILLCDLVRQTWNEQVG